MVGCTLWHSAYGQWSSVMEVVHVDFLDVSNLTLYSEFVKLSHWLKPILLLWQILQ